MGIMDTDRTLASNRLIFEIRRDPELYDSFPAAMERFFDAYDLSQEERQAWRDKDIGRLAELGVHPYFLPQLSRLFHGSAYNHNRSEAALAYAQHMVEQ